MHIDVSKRWWAAGVAAVLAVGAGAAYVATREPAGPAVAAAASAPPRARAEIPLEIAQDSLDAQSAALLAGDEKGWLAAVDPAQPELRARYRTLYASLRGLGVTVFDYGFFPVWTTEPTAARLDLRARIGYCLGGNTCATDPDDNPLLRQDLALKPAGGRYLITSMTEPKLRGDSAGQPVPWADGGKLIFATGKRVTVVAPPAQRRYVAQVLTLADRSAVIADRFAGSLGTRPPRYRVYLAGAAQWRTWYGGGRRRTTVGYAWALRDIGTDVVLDMDRLSQDHSLLAHTIQHELGHVVTVGGASSARAHGDMWMREGIAEYIGWYPQTALDSWRRPAVHRSLRSGRPLRSIAAGAMADDATRDETDSYYGFAHFAADCLGRTYGRPRLLAFADQYLRHGLDLETAARKAFGQSFATVDRTCVAWIRANA